MMRKAVLQITSVLMLCALALPAAQAEVTHSGDSSFTVSHTTDTSASPAEAWATLTERIAEWWHPDHSWSGDAANFSIRAELGGCFCERLPGTDGKPDGGVEHLRIIYIKSGEEIRFDGSLGPLIDMPVQGRMSWAISPASDGAAGSRITFTYRVHGYMEGGFTSLAPEVDGVIGQQVQRLQALLNP